jgi:hypothetical protein
MKKKDQWEEDAKDHFIAALKDAGRGDWTVSDTDVVVDKATNRNFDYQLQSGESRIALEIFRLVEGKEELVRQKTWSIVANSIAAELRKRGVKEYTIRVPYAFDVPAAKILDLVRSTADQLEAAISSDPEADTIEVGEFEIKRIKDFQDVSLFGVGPGGAVNPTGTAYDFIARKLPHKNRQLEIADHERVVLIVNGAMIVDPSNLIEACTQIDFSKVEHIDNVYVENPNTKAVQLVYDRKIYAAFQPRGNPPEHIDDPLFISWLANRLYQIDDQAFHLVRTITEQKKTLLWLPALSREQLVVFGERSLESGDLERLNWIINSLVNDPDPPVENEPNDPEGEHNDHLRTKKGETNFLIHSVRPRMCWLLVKMVTQPLLGEYERIFGIVEHFATGENLYVRTHAAVPLIELAKRRLLKVDAHTRFMSDQLSDRIKNLALRMIAENIPYPAVLVWAMHVIVPIRDLDHDTVLQLIKTALPISESEATNDIAWMIVYYSLFREHHFQNLAPFKSDAIRGLLKDQLANGTPSIRAATIQQLKTILDQKEREFLDVVPYLEAFVSGRSVRVANYHLYGLLAQHGAASPDIVMRLIEQAVAQELKLLDGGGQVQVWHPKGFSDALHAIEQSGPELKNRVEQLRRSIQPYKDRYRIHDVHGF